MVQHLAFRLHFARQLGPESSIRMTLIALIVEQAPQENENNKIALIVEKAPQENAIESLFHRASLFTSQVYSHH